MVGIRKLLRAVRRLFGLAPPSQRGSAAPAPAFTWTAATEGDWEDPGNWEGSAGGVPAAGDFVTLAENPLPVNRPD